MTDFGKKIFPLPMRVIDASTFNGSFLPVSDAVDEPIRIARFINDTDQDVTVSWDGVQNHDFVPAKTALTLDVTSNKTDEGGYFIAVGTQFFVSASVGTGFFNIALYGSDG